MNFSSLSQNIVSTHQALHAIAVKSINQSLTVRNWLIGYYIVEFEQNGIDRAGYGSKLLKELSQSLSIKGLSETNLKLFRQFYISYPEIGQAVSDFFHKSQISQTVSDLLLGANRNVFKSLALKSIPVSKLGVSSEKFLHSLSFSHIVELLKIKDPIKKAFYEIECIKGTWSVRELQRQIESLYFERYGLTKNKKKLSDIVCQNAVKLNANDILNDPISIEFLGLNENALVTESVLEQKILDNLQLFLLELGHGFCFESRQKRILIDDEYYFVDLVFYHRILKCHILIDLKIEKFKHSFADQMNAYLNFFKHEVMQTDDNPPVGILLCSDKGKTMVKYATAGLEHNVFVHQYLVNLPSKEDLEKYIENEMMII